MERKGTYFKGLTRREYIAKANEIIRQEGIGAVTIRRMAKEMGCSTASLYRYFDSLEELIYYAELGEMNDYIKSLNDAEKNWKSVWDIYVGVWYCYSMEAFRKPEAYNLLFFANNNNKLRVSIREYYKMFPENLKLSNRVFHEMLQTPDFMGRDFEMCRKCIRSNAIGYDNAVALNRMVCLLFKGYFKTVCDEGIKEEEISRRVRQFIRDIEKLVYLFAKDLKGYKEYKIK